MLVSSLLPLTDSLGLHSWHSVFHNLFFLPYFFFFFRWTCSRSFLSLCSLCLSPSLPLFYPVRESREVTMLSKAWRSSIDCSCLSATLSHQSLSPISRRLMLSFPSSVASQRRGPKCHKGFVETLYQMMGSFKITFFDEYILSSSYLLLSYSDF